MVRLLRDKPCSQHWLTRFNPTMVRLLLHDYTDIVAEVLAFQSHNGAIAAVDFSPTVRWQNACFNPTMVRLLQCPHSSSYIPPCMFQSHNGAIAASNKLS